MSNHVTPEDFSLTWGDIRMLIAEKPYAEQVKTLTKTFFFGEDVAKRWVDEARKK